MLLQWLEQTPGSRFQSTSGALRRADLHEPRDSRVRTVPLRRRTCLSPEFESVPTALSSELSTFNGQPHPRRSRADCAVIRWRVHGSCMRPCTQRTVVATSTPWRTSPGMCRVVLSLPCDAIQSSPIRASVPGHRCNLPRLLVTALLKRLGVE
ncbi:hypothetical protein BC628DRAFT_166117 [Trametes gibbosa]|nr:hypothetical protein BC628DRAFT_166117 [Trametes gibbosa]